MSVKATTINQQLQSQAAFVSAKGNVLFCAKWKLALEHAHNYWQFHIAIKSQQCDKAKEKIKAWKQHVPLEACNPLKNAQFCAILAELQANNDVTAKHKISTPMVFLFHLIGKFDNHCEWPHVI